MQVKKYFTITLLSSLAMTAYGNEVNQQIIQAQQQDNSRGCSRLATMLYYKNEDNIL
ncbi:hypothetical protein [Avibacterium avium]|uniref:Uncharacterized protein n=1 Tax=Avibacterium avium TaxID=751 RepID=A0A379ASC9_AVIAV|nr:hypothetical protein [Avibacterium avium]SUB24519.1 Uncharacterised protein [Avibacterium avium]